MKYNRGESFTLSTSDLVAQYFEIIIKIVVDRGEINSLLVLKITIILEMSKNRHFLKERSD